MVPGGGARLEVLVVFSCFFRVCLHESVSAAPKSAFVETRPIACDDVHPETPLICPHVVLLIFFQWPGRCQCDVDDAGGTQSHMSAGETVSRPRPPAIECQIRFLWRQGQPSPCPPCLSRCATEAAPPFLIAQGPRLASHQSDTATCIPSSIRSLRLGTSTTFQGLTFLLSLLLAAATALY